MFSSETTGPSPFEVESLYALYIQVAERTLANVDAVVPEGEMRDYFRSLHRPLPKEHFEARLADIYMDEERYERVTELLHCAAHEELPRDWDLE